MRRIVMAITFSTFLFVSNSFAASESIHKLGRGITNVVTAPVEIPKELRAHWIKGSEKTYHISAWLFCGLVKGIVMTPVRMGSGVWDIVTSPLAIPKDYQPLLKPDYVFDDWPKRKEGVVYKQFGDK